MDDLTRRIAASFNDQGVMALLGARLVHVSAGEVHIALSPRPELCQRQGQIHAGALTGILDSACVYAAMTGAASGVEMLTLEFKVKFIRPAACADSFVAVARIMKQVGTGLTMCQGEIIGEQGSQKVPVAVMKATIRHVPSDA